MTINNMMMIIIIIIRKAILANSKEKIDWLTCPDKPSTRVPSIDKVSRGNYCYCYYKGPKQVYYYSSHYHKGCDNYPIKRS